MLAFAAALALLCVACFTAASVLRLGFVGTIVGAYLFASAAIVLITEVLSPFGAIGVPGYLFGEAVFAFAAVAAWMYDGRPLPALPRLTRGWTRRHWPLVLFGAAVGSALAFEAFVVVASAPNNWDSMTYHLSRAAAWYQHGSLARFEAHTPRENIFPPNAEIQSLWTMVPLHSDRLAALPQFAAQLALLVAIFGIGRRLGFTRPASAFASLIFATLSEVALQATSTQNDLVVSAYVVAGVYLLLGRTRRELWLAAAAFGLAAGTKLTALYAMPVVALVAVSVLPRRRLAELAIAAGLAFAALGAWVYVANVMHDGDPLGPAAVRKPFTPALTVGRVESTFARILYRFADLSGYPVDLRMRERLQHVGGFVFDALGVEQNPPGATQTQFRLQPNVRVNEDISYFGPLGLFLVLPLSVGYLGASALRRTSRVKCALALAVPMYALEVALTYRYNLWLGRFMIVPVALGAALAARVYAARLVSATFACFGVVFLFLALAHNERKPIGLDGSAPFWSLSRTDMQALGAPWYTQTLEVVNVVVPARAKVGYALGDEDLDYPLYGPAFERRLVPLRADPLREASALGLRWVVTSEDTRAGNGWTGVVFPDSGWRLFTPAGTGDARELVRYVRTTPPSSGFTRAARYLVGDLATAQSESPIGTGTRSSTRSTGTSRS